MNLWAVPTTSVDGAGQEAGWAVSLAAGFPAVLRLLVPPTRGFDTLWAGEPEGTGSSDRPEAAAQTTELRAPVSPEGGVPAPVVGSPTQPPPQPAQVAGGRPGEGRGSQEGPPEGRDVFSGSDVAQTTGGPAEEQPADTRRALLGWVTGAEFSPTAVATPTTPFGELEIPGQGANVTPAGAGKAARYVGGPGTPSPLGQGREGAPREIQPVKRNRVGQSDPVPARSGQAQPLPLPAAPSPGTARGSGGARVELHREPVMKLAPRAAPESPAGELEVPRPSEAEVSGSQQVGPPAGAEGAAPRPRPADAAGATSDRPLSGPGPVLEGGQLSGFGTRETFSRASPQVAAPAQPPRSDAPVGPEAKKPEFSVGHRPAVDHPEEFLGPPEGGSDGRVEDRSGEPAGPTAKGERSALIRPEAHLSDHTWRTPDHGVQHRGEQVTEARIWPERPESQAPPQRLRVEVPDARGDPIRVDVKARSEAVWVRVEGGPEVLQAVRGGQVDLQYALGQHGLSLAGLEVDTLARGRRGPDELPQPVGLRTSPAKSAGSVRVVAAGAVDYVV